MRTDWRQPGRRRLLAVAMPVGMTVVLTMPLAALAAPPPTLSDAVAVLEKERSAAEQYAVVLATVGRKDMDRYVRGIQLYADAKAEFDGLIAALRVDLIEGNNPAKSQRLPPRCKVRPKSVSPSPTSSAMRWWARSRVPGRVCWTW